MHQLLSYPFYKAYVGLRFNLETLTIKSYNIYNHNSISSDSHSLTSKWLISISTSVYCCGIHPLLLLSIRLWLISINLIVLILIVALSLLVKRLLVVSFVIISLVPPVKTSHHASVDASSLQSHLIIGHAFEFSVSAETDHYCNDGEHKPDHVHCHLVWCVLIVALSGSVSFYEISVLDLQTHYTHILDHIVEHHYHVED